MEEINIKTLLYYYLERIKYIILSMFICALIGVFYTFIFNKGYYQSISSLSIDSKDVNYIKNTTSAYVNKVATSDNLNIVKKELNLDYDINELKNMIYVESDINSTLLNIYVNSNNLNESFRINSYLTDLFIESTYDNDLEFTEVYIVNKASNPLSRTITLKDHIKDILISAILGFILSFILIFVIFFFDLSIKCEDDIKKEKLLGVVPKKGNKEYKDSINNIVTNINLLGSNKVIMISGLEYEDNNYNLIEDIAKNFKNKKVIVLDMDLSNIDKNDKNDKNGYSNLIGNINKLDNYIIKKDHYDILTKGNDNKNVIDLLLSNDNSILFSKLKEKYDYVLINTLPIQEITGSIKLLEYTDYNILLATRNKTKIESLDKAKNIIKENNYNLDGLIITNNNPKYNNFPKYFSKYYYKK